MNDYLCIILIFLNCCMTAVNKCKITIDSDQDRTEFSNPITKNTFQALPKIYGTKKKKKYLMKYQFQYKRINQSKYLHEVKQEENMTKLIDKSISINSRDLSAFKPKVRKIEGIRQINETALKRYRTEVSQRNLTQKLSKPRQEFCSKKYCICSKIHQQRINAISKRSYVLKKSKQKSYSIQLPKLQQNESKHKINTINNDEETQRDKEGISLVQLVRSHANKSNTSKISVKNSRVNLTARNRVQIAIQVDPSQCQEREPQPQPVHQQHEDSPAERDSHNECTSEEASQVSSISSVSLSKYVFLGMEKRETMFSSLSKIQHVKRPANVEKREKFKYQKKNGLFIIPEEDEFVTYLKDYQPMGKHFKINKLVKKDNFAVLKTEDGVFFGEVQNDIKQGSGLLITEKQIFEGKFDNNVKVTGHQRNIDGIYKGEFVNGLREGHGSFQWNNGEIFEGEWKQGTKNGFGTWRSPKGDFYQGQWLMNRQTGKGTYRHRLSTYRGEFLNFLKHGSGQQIFLNGDTYIGSYNLGKPHGYGTYKWQDGSIYEGQFSNGFRDGKGKWSQANGIVYEGAFKNDFKEGEGKQSYPSGEYFAGIFKGGNKLSGTLHDSKGNIIQITKQES